jgi:putative FmdB family regulatory protein
MVGWVNGLDAMPTYDYRCPNGHTFELFQRMSDPLPAACEVCGAAPVERVLFPVAVHFKGSGFYSTDYGRGAKKREGSKDGEPATGEAKKKDEKAASASSAPDS